MAITITDQGLLRLLQLSSASLPVGGYAFSQGLEYAIDSQWLKDADDVEHWVRLLMHESMATTDLPVLIRLANAALTQDMEAMTYWNAYLLACRESNELRLTETATGEALARLLTKLSIPLPTMIHGNEALPWSFIAAFATAAVHWQVDQRAMLVGYLWSWLDNQIAAATKLVPLGQTSAQQLLVKLGDDIASVIHRAEAIEDHEIGTSLPGLAMASCWHETQYSRLFRS